MQALAPYIAIALGLLGLAILFSGSRKRRPGGKAASPYTARAFQTPNEVEFWRRLTAAAPEFLVFPQVAMGALVGVRAGLDSKARMSALGAYNQKRVDYVIADRNTLEPLLLVELDDKTHRPLADEKRDAITQAAGYRTLRYLSREKPPVPKLRADILAITGPRPKDSIPSFQGRPQADRPGVPASLH